MPIDDNIIPVILPNSVRVLMPNGQVEDIKLETYLAGVVSAEIGATAPLEALKAQAVTSRTYVASAERHQEQEADVCTTAHCQKWKLVDPVSAPEIFRALSETWGMVVTFEGNLINAFFFEHCDGHTRDAEAMLMPAMPYLRGVDCSCGFLALKGHGVGMCKRGAIVMARRGSSFEQILQHYYRGVVIMQATQESPIGSEEGVERASKSQRLTKRSSTKKSKEPTITPPKPMTFERPAMTNPAGGTVSKTMRSSQAAPVRPVSNTGSGPLKKEVDSRVAGFQSEVNRGIVPPQESASKSGQYSENQIKSQMPVIDHARTKPTKRVHIDHLPGQRMIAGCLSRAGVVILIEDDRGNKTLVVSGTALHYGEGGFETMIEADGHYKVTIDDQIVEADVAGETVFIHAE